MRRESFKIVGLDCAEEIAILKREIGPLVGGDAHLSFDVLRGKMTVLDGATDVDESRLIEAVARTGMRAQPWEEYTAQASAAETQPWWRRNIRLILCITSGACLVAATLANAWIHGLHAAFAAHHGGEHVLPLFSVVAYLAAIVAGGWMVFPKAVFSARRLRPDMNLLMTVAVIGAIILNEWFEAASVAFLFSLALLLESWSVGRARRAIAALINVSPQMARVKCPHDGCLEEKPVGQVQVGAIVQVRPGERIPLDGEVLSGATLVNEAAITGESMPVSKEVGDDVYAGTVSGDGLFEFRVTKPASETTLARIIKLVEEAHARRAPSEQWVERFARVYTPTIMLLALAVAIVPPIFAGGWERWFYEGLVILVIACPCALVISTPVSIVAGLASAARAGVLIKGGLYLELPAAIRAVAIDKTGTVTHGEPVVQSVVPLNGHDHFELLRRAASLEAQSNHPLAVAILNDARAKQIPFEAVGEYQMVQGKGAQGRFDNRTFWIGSHRFLHEKTAETPECQSTAVAMEDAGHSVIAIGNEAHVCGLISVADQVRGEAAQFVADLRAAGVEHVVMLTGDNEGTASAVAKAIRADAHRSELLPEEKVAAVRELAARYGKTAMIGDGVNDAPAMAASDLSIAMAAAGSDVAIETADVALMSDDLSKVPWLIRHSKRTLRIIKQNIVFALGLKVVFIVLAFAGMATLWMAIAADTGASLLVIANGLRMLRAR